MNVRRRCSADTAVVKTPPGVWKGPAASSTRVTSFFHSVRRGRDRFTVGSIPPTDPFPIVANGDLSSPVTVRPAIDEIRTAASREPEALNARHATRRAVRVCYTFLYAWSHRGRQSRRALVPRVTLLPLAERPYILCWSYARQMGHDEKAPALRRPRSSPRKAAGRKKLSARLYDPVEADGKSKGPGPLFPPGDPPRDFERNRREIAIRRSRIDLVQAEVQTPSVAVGAFLSYRNNNSREVLKS